MEMKQVFYGETKRWQENYIKPTCT